jgi:hypothetical protein
MKLVILLLAVVISTCSNPYLPTYQEIERAKSVVQKFNLPLMILSLPITYDRSGKKIGVFPHILSLGTKSISKLNIHLIPYNIVGDSVKSEAPPYQSLFSLKLAGQMESTEKTLKFKVEEIWESESIHCVRVNKVEVVYSDYEEEVISDSEKLKLIAPFDHCPK